MLGYWSLMLVTVRQQTLSLINYMENQNQRLFLSFTTLEAETNSKLPTLGDYRCATLYPDTIKIIIIPLEFNRGEILDEQTLEQRTIVLRTVVSFFPTKIKKVIYIEKLNIFRS